MPHVVAQASSPNIVEARRRRSENCYVAAVVSCARTRSR